MTRHRSFTTAAARRKADPIVWTVDGTDLLLRATIDIVEVAAALETLRDPVDGNGAKAVAEKRAAMLDIMRGFIEPSHHDAFAEVAPNLDMNLLAEMIRDAAQEYSGAANPTSAPSSSDGSPVTGESSTAGALPVAST